MAWKSPLWAWYLKMVGVRRNGGLTGIFREISTSTNAARRQEKGAAHPYQSPITV
jgi:hypothetical protein